MSLIPNLSWSKWGKKLEEEMAKDRVIPNSDKVCIKLLTEVITKARDETYVTARLMQDTMNPTNIIGAEIYEQMRRTHEFLRNVVQVLEKGDNEKPV